MSPPAAPVAGDVRYPSIEGLRAFDAAARLGSFERAGEELAVTASAVSKRVAALETLLGAPVFRRTAKALLLTAGGRDGNEPKRPLTRHGGRTQLHAIAAARRDGATRCLH